MKKQYIAGIDLGGTTAKLGLFTLAGELVQKWEIPTDTTNHGENILRNLADSLCAQLAARGLTPEDVLGVGLAVPGAVTQERYAGPGANLNGWGGFDVAAAFSPLCGLPVKVANDADAASLGELWRGSAMGARNMLFVTLGTGVGGGVVINGHVVEGAHGAGGEIGHIRMHTDEQRVCGCGRRGCLEQYASATGLVYAANKLLSSTTEPSPLRQYEEITAKLIFDHAKAGDALALRLTDTFAAELGRALSMIACVCDPEVIVLGGGVSKAGTFLLDAVRDAYRKEAWAATEATDFRLAALGNRAGMYGAARLMLG